MPITLREYFNEKLEQWGKNHSDEDEVKVVTAIDGMLGTSHRTPADERWEKLSQWLNKASEDRELTWDEFIDLIFGMKTADEVARFFGDLTQ